MGLVEEVLERVSLKAALLALVSGCVLYYAYLKIGENAKLRRLGGGRARKLPSSLPLGKPNSISAAISSAVEGHGSGSVTPPPLLDGEQS